MNAIERFVPLVHVIRTYQPRWLCYDILAGLSIFAILVPSAMAYGSLAGVDPVYGLYASLVGMVIYAVFASSRLLVVGPEAATSLLIASTLAALGIRDPVQYILFAAALALVAGGLLVAAGVLKLGFIAEFMSKPVLVGFLNGAALIIIGSQLSKLFGIPINSNAFFQQVAELLSKLGETQIPTLIFALTAIATLIILRAIAPKLPAALIVVGLAVVAGFILNPADNGVAVVGEIPRGLPSFALPTLSIIDLISLLPGAISIAVLSFPNSILTARVFADKANQEIDPNQELMAVGLANVGVAFFQGFPVSGSQSRTALNSASGAKTPLSSIFGAVVLALFLLFFAPILANLPLAVLGAIIVVTAINLIDIRSVVVLFRVQFFSGILSVATTLGVLTIGIIPAILVAVILSLFYLISRIYRPHDAVLGQVAEGEVFDEINLKDYINPFPGFIVYRFGAPLIFANVQYFVQRVRQLIESLPEPPRMLLLSAEAVTAADITAVETLEKFLVEMHNKGISFGVARATLPLRKDFFKMGLTDKIGEDRFYPSVRAGLQAYLAEQHDAHTKAEGEGHLEA